MKIVKNIKFKEQYLEETLDNGLKVILWNKPGYNKSFFVMSTPFGGCDNRQIDNNDQIHEYPEGIAHFLEHKMFETKGEDVLETFSKMGANTNAFTSYNETAYYFSTSEDPTDGLNLLLDFVQKLEIDEASVEKEKGIIIQELEMYKQMADIRLISESLSNIYVNHPLKEDIGGTAESVNSITYEKLVDCYNLNYHPSKMILIGISGEDPYKLLEIIKKNQADKKFMDVVHVERVDNPEPYQVKCHKFELSMPISNNKVSYVFKFNGFKDTVLAHRKEWCFKIILDAYFTSINPDYQKWLDDEIINDSFGFEVDFGKDYGLILFENETKDPDKFYELIYNTLMKITDIDNDILEILKSRYYGNNIRSLNEFENLALDFLRKYFNNIDYFKDLELIEDITKEEILETFKLLDLDNSCKVIIHPEK